jgi:DNA recombination protein RmuC
MDQIWIIGAIAFSGGILVASMAWMWRYSRLASNLGAIEAERARLFTELAERETTCSRLETALEDADRRREDAERDLAVHRDRSTSLAETHERLSRELEQLRTDRDRLRDDAARLEERAAALETAERRLTETFKAAGADALRQNREEFLGLATQVFAHQSEQFVGETERRQQKLDELVTPIRDLLNTQKNLLEQFENTTRETHAGLVERLSSITTGQQELRQETSRLVTALRRPETRGRWGELQLRNAVEMAGMTRYCDFSEQVQTDEAGSRDRPDMTVNLPGGGVIVVDSKVAIDAYLDALEPDADRDAAMARHATQVETHVRRLAAKEYWEQFERTPGVVVMFMPLESALVAALEVKPDLHAVAMEKRVLIATPTLLVALLRAVAYGWQQEDIAANAREIADVGRQLYDRIRTLTQHIQNVGRTLRQTVDHYNKAVGSVERMLLPSARRLKDLGAASQQADVEAPPPLEGEPRDVLVAEVLPGGTESLGGGTDDSAKGE